VIKVTAKLDSRTVTDTAPDAESALKIILCELRKEKMQITLELEADGLTGVMVGTSIPIE
jgi:hypothetical protein